MVMVLFTTQGTMHRLPIMIKSYEEAGILFFGGEMPSYWVENCERLAEIEGYPIIRI